MSSAKFGDRVGAIRGSIDGTNQIAFFGYGVYESDDCPFFPVSNPAIKLDSGGYVYGFECWWGPEEKIKGLKKEYAEKGYEIVFVDAPKREEKQS